MDCSTIATHLHESNAPLHALGDSAVPCSLADSSCARFSFHFCTIVFSIWITLFSLGSQLGIEICCFFPLSTGVKWFPFWHAIRRTREWLCVLWIQLQPFSNIQRPYTTRIIISSIFTAFYFIRLKQNSISMFVLFFAFHFFSALVALRKQHIVVLHFRTQTHHQPSPPPTGSPNVTEC